jgi:two-component system, sporulation sensor kinase A
MFKDKIISNAERTNIEQASINSTLRWNVRYLPDFLFTFNKKMQLVNYGCLSNSKNCKVPEKPVGKSLIDLFDPGITKLFEQEFCKVLESKTPAAVEYTYPVGYINKIFISRFIPASDNNVIILSKEVTKVRRAEEALEQTELRFRSVWENSIDGMRLIDLNGYIVAANDAYSKLTGLKPEEYLGKAFSSVYSPASNEKLKLTFEKFRNNFTERKIKPFFEMEAEFRSGKKLVIEVSNKFIEPEGDKGIEGEVLLLSIFRDITARKNAELILKESEEKYRSLIDTSPDPIILLGKKGDILMVNQQFCNTFLIPNKEEVVGTTIKNYLSESDTQKLSDTLKALLKSKSITNREYNFVKRNGEMFPVEINASVVINSKTIVAVIRDISTRKEAENALRNSELRFRSVWENSADGMRLTDIDGNIIAVNNSFCSITGIPENELLGIPFYEIFSGRTNEDNENSRKKYRNGFRKGKFQPVSLPNAKFKSGKTADVEITYSIIEYIIGEPMLLSIFHDVTERKKTEEELRKSEKLAAIGKMAAYLSHEIKTPLASIRMNIDLITRDSEISEGKQKSLRIIQKEIKRLNKLLKNVLQYSKNIDLLIVNINLGIMINNIKEFIQPQLDEKNIQMYNDVENIKINGDYQKLQSVFLHLIENSVDSIEKNGTIRISAVEDEDHDSTTIFFKDDGCGTTSGDQIFEPFYTTKNTGTGLGLAIAQRIIEQHNGVLKLYSSKPGETIFALTFFNYGL